NFEFKILCYCNKNQLKDRERFYMNFYNSTNLLCGYNIALNTIAPMKGRHHSQEAKKKIGDAQKGEKNHNYGKITPQAVKEKLSQANLGRIKTEDEKRKLSQANKGKKPSLRAIEASRKAVYFTRYKNFVSEWQKLNKQGVTYRKISKMFNVGEKTVSLYIKHFSTISISPPV
ncbi:MAG: NUMOD3 domain-containing DNA-binding protein, partial [Candidatus Eremiobacterota bacterium]